MIPYVIVGCGGHGAHHAQAAQDAGGFKLVGAFDPDPAVAARLLQRFNPTATAFESLEALLKKCMY